MTAIRNKVNTVVRSLKNFQDDYNYLYSRFTTIVKS